MDTICPNRFSIIQGADTLDMAYCSNFDLEASNSAVTRAVIILHGSSRNADDYYSYVENAANSEGISDALIIAPQFLADEDISAHNLQDSNVLYFDSDSWKEGGQSLTSPYSRQFNLSSFTVVDKLIESVSDRNIFPNLNKIVVAGHSAGGQFSNRYAAGSQIEQTLSGVGNSYHYIVANPSSYLYFDAKRRNPGTLDQFRLLTTQEKKKCKNYNNYKYGLINLNSYMGNAGTNTIISQYQNKKVVYLLGSLDTNPHDDSLDTSCMGKWQGAHRLERGTIYYNYIGQFFGSSIYTNHVKSIVEGVDHSANDMWNSQNGKFYLFNY